MGPNFGSMIRSPDSADRETDEKAAQMALPWNALADGGCRMEKGEGGRGGGGGGKWDRKRTLSKHRSYFIAPSFIIHFPSLWTFSEAPMYLESK